jgi:hypothetical protein
MRRNRQKTKGIAVNPEADAAKEWENFLNSIAKKESHV